MRVFIVKPYVRVMLDESSRILFSVWQGFATSDELMAIGERILEIVSKESVRKVLFDTREMELIDDYSQSFISGAYTLDMIKAGVQYAATVLPRDEVAQESLDHIRELSHIPGDHNRFFADYDEAIDWLSDRKPA